MAWFALFSGKPVQEFAQSLADQLVKRYPPALDHEPSKRPSVNRLTRLIEDTCQRARVFQDENKLGWIGKARLGNAFRWALKEAGYTEAFVEFATEALVVHISKKSV